MEFIDGEPVLDRPSAAEVETYLQRYTRRRPRSKWSRLDISKVERLAAEGRMRPARMAEVRAAQADGRWDNPWT